MRQLAVITAALAVLVVGAADAAGYRFCGFSPSGVYQVRAWRPTTSCGFATNVMRAVRRHQIRVGGLKRGSRFTVRASSPATRRIYRVRCSVARTDAPFIRCTAGNGARVQLVAAA